MKTLLKISLIMSSATIINIFLNLVKTKVMALVLGTMGMGVYALLQSIYTLFTAFSGITSGGSVVRLVSEEHHKEDWKQLYRLKQVLLTTALTIGVVMALVIWVFRESITGFAFEDTTYATEVGLVGLILSFANLSAFWLAWLNGFREIKTIAKLKVYSTAVVALLTIIMVYLFEAKAVIWAVLIMPIPSLWFGWRYGRCMRCEVTAVEKSDVSPILRGVVSLGMILFINTLIFQAGVFTTRSIISRELGIESVGIFLAAWSISVVYIEIFLSSLSVDFYPRLVGHKDSSNRIIEAVNEQIHFSLLVIFPALLFLYTFSDSIISLMYSDAFVGAALVLKWQLLGDLFKVMVWIFGYVFIVRNYLYISLTLQVLWVGGYLILLVLGIGDYGLKITGIAFTINYIIGFFLSYLLLRHKIDFRFSKENNYLFGIIVFGIILMLFSELFMSNRCILFQSALASVATLYSVVKINKQMEGKLWKKIKTRLLR